MKYWYFSEGKVAGPLEAKELIKVAGFGASTLVCPENLTGTNAEDWKSAFDFPELAKGVPEEAAASAESGPKSQEETSKPFSAFIEQIQPVLEKIQSFEKEIQELKNKLESLRGQQEAAAADLKKDLSSKIEQTIERQVYDFNEFRGEFARWAEDISQKMEERIKAPAAPEPAAPEPITTAPPLAEIIEPPKPPAPAAKKKTVETSFTRAALAATAALTVFSLMIAGGVAYMAYFKPELLGPLKELAKAETSAAPQTVSLPRQEPMIPPVEQPKNKETASNENKKQTPEQTAKTGQEALKPKMKKPAPDLAQKSDLTPAKPALVPQKTEETPKSLAPINLPGLSADTAQRSPSIPLKDRDEEPSELPSP